MDELVKILPELVKQASSSPLGILALVAISLALLAAYFFKHAPVKVRIGVFVLMVLGAAIFVAAIFQQLGPISLERRMAESKQITIPNLRNESGRKEVYESFSRHIDEMPPAEQLATRRSFTIGWLQSAGRNVSDLKQVLSRLDYYHGPSDDTFDRELADAIILFQKDHNLVPADGICGEMCFKEINKLVAAIGGRRPE